jgi:hypothetical protein
MVTSGGSSSTVDVALHAADGVLEQPGVGVETDLRDEAALLGAEQVAGAAQLQVLHGDVVAAAELGVVLQDAQPLLGVLA